SDDDKDGPSNVPTVSVDGLSGNLINLAVTEFPRNYSFKFVMNRTSDDYAICEAVVDEELVDAYNSQNNASAILLPETNYSLDGFTILKPGETVSQEMTITFSSTSGLEYGNTYLLPVRMAIDSELTDKFAIESQDQVYYFVIDGDKQTVWKSGIDMSGFMTPVNFTIPGSEVRLEDNTHTFEMYIYPYNWHSGTNYIGTWRGIDYNESASGAAFSGCELRVSGTDGTTNIGNRQVDFPSTTLPTDQWVLISITCEGTLTDQTVDPAYWLYVNGQLVGSVAPQKRYTGSSQGYHAWYTFNGMMLGNSGYYFEGLVGEMRMWKDCLSQSEIQANMQQVQDPSALYGYWKVDEGSGSVLTDSSGNGRDLTTTTSLPWGSEIF
ncbi:MAG: DUF1735 and LamG domain-containing protein, partial [Alistipes sp.]|nr:DUF1735 and LamG domain-containing protein [Alistipes sp.]